MAFKVSDFDCIQNYRGLVAALEKIHAEGERLDAEVGADGWEEDDDALADVQNYVGRNDRYQDWLVTAGQNEGFEIAGLADWLHSL